MQSPHHLAITPHDFVTPHPLNHASMPPCLHARPHHHDFFLTHSNPPEPRPRSRPSIPILKLVSSHLKSLKKGTTYTNLLTNPSSLTLTRFIIAHPLANLVLRRRLIGNGRALTNLFTNPSVLTLGRPAKAHPLTDFGHR